MSDEVKTTEPMLIGKYHDITPFAGTDKTRAVLNGVHYNAEHKALEATDGAMLIRVPVCQRTEDFPAVKAGDKELRDCIIPTAPFKKGLANIPKGMNLPVLSYAKLSANGDGKATLATTDLDTEQAVTARCVAGEYPKVDQVWPTTEPTLRIALSAALLRRLADYADKHGKVLDNNTSHPGVAVNLSFTDNLSAVRFDFILDTPTGELTKAEGVLMPMRLT